MGLLRTQSLSGGTPVATLPEGSARLVSAPFPTDMEAFEAFARQSQLQGFVFGFVDSETKVVTSYFQRLPRARHDPTRHTTRP
jgi:hypothetical protein